MVRRSAAVLLAVLLCGCPDDIGGSVGGVVTTLRAPGDLKGVPNGGSEIVLTWKDRANDETGYRLEMNFSPFGTPFIGGVEFLPENATSLTFPSFPNTTYYFRVFAVTAVMESDPSEVIVVSTPDVPERPTGVQASPQSTTQIAVKWADVFNETGYRIELSTDESKTWIPRTTVGSNLLGSPLSGLSPDSEYLVRIVAFNSNGDSTPSVSVRASTVSNLVSLIVAYGADTGTFSSYQITPDGVEHVSHFDASFTNVLYTTRPASGSFTTWTVDGGTTPDASVGGDGTSIALDGAGKVHIAVHDQTLDKVRYITNETGGWIAKNLALFPSFKIGAKPTILWDASSGRIHIYHLALSNGLPAVADVCKTGPIAWTFSQPLPMALGTSNAYSAAVDDSGTRHIVLVSQDSELWHFQEDGIPDPSHAPRSERIPLPSTSSAPDFTRVVTPGNAVHVVFHDASSSSLHYATQVSGAWTTQTIERNEGQDLGLFCALAVHRPSGRIHVAYYDATNRDLKYARKDPGGAWVRKVLDVDGDVGSHPSIAVDGAGVVHIAYRDETNRRLKVATGTP
jgi:hypothetical protein